MKWRCRYRGSTTGETWESDNDNSEWASNIICERLKEPPKMNYVPASEANYGDSPSGPNAPEIDTDPPYTDPDAPATPAKAKASAAAGECFGCRVKRFVSDNAMLLLALLLALFLFWKRKKS